MKHTKASEEKGLKVKLTDDLTRYHKSLVVGTIGTTCGLQGMWARQQSDRFVTVKFPEVTLDILWRGLEPCK